MQIYGKFNFFSNFAAKWACRETCRTRKNKINQPKHKTLHTGRFKLLLFAAILFVFVSCEDTHSSQVIPEGKGLVYLDLCPKIEIKSTQTQSEGFDDYNFRFVGVDGYATSEYYRYGDVVWPMPWYFGIFRLQAESCSAEEAEVLRGRLRYEGISDRFSVINGHTATASVICEVANFQVKVNFDDTMYEAFDDYKLTVMSESAPPAEDEDAEEEEASEEFTPQTYRSLEFTHFEQSGYYNLQDEPVQLKYVLYVRMPEAEEMIEAKEGYFCEGDTDEPSVVGAGDVITLNVSYTGEVNITDGVKFIIKGTKVTVDTGLGLQDYVSAEVDEDK